VTARLVLESSGGIAVGTVDEQARAKLGFRVDPLVELRRCNDRRAGQDGAALDEDQLARDRDERGHIPEPLRRQCRERVEVIRAALQEADAVVLQDLLEFVRDRVVRAVTFLAMLELVKRREITVEQDEPFGPILARRVVREGGA
jgi:hypothetical protein